MMRSYAADLLRSIVRQGTHYPTQWHHRLRAILSIVISAICLAYAVQWFVVHSTTIALPTQPLWWVGCLLLTPVNLWLEARRRLRPEHMDISTHLRQVLVGITLSFSISPILADWLARQNRITITDIRSQSQAWVAQSAVMSSITLAGACIAWHVPVLQQALPSHLVLYMGIALHIALALALATSIFARRFQGLKLAFWGGAARYSIFILQWLCLYAAWSMPDSASFWVLTLPLVWGLRVLVPVLPAWGEAGFRAGVFVFLFGALPHIAVMSQAVLWLWVCNAALPGLVGVYFILKPVTMQNTEAWS